MVGKKRTRRVISIEGQQNLMPTKLSCNGVILQGKIRTIFCLWNSECIIAIILILYLFIINKNFVTKET